jgi:hypothetical protein
LRDTPDSNAFNIIVSSNKDKENINSLLIRRLVDKIVFFSTVKYNLVK